ncbi:hypothetical protein KJA13_01015 [Patescibacteria group bacterium]|nr:hypothetical protein [Patescibacteria group bacterium]
MASSKFNSNGGEKFFGAVTKNCKVVVGSSKKAVREEIAQRGVAKNNIAMFECQPNERKIKKKLLHKPRFKLMARHHVALENACLIFLGDRMGT